MIFFLNAHFNFFFEVEKKLMIVSALSHLMILGYLLSAFFSRLVHPTTQAEYFLPELEEPTVGRERTTK